jgi:hypothetical protein
MTDVPAICRISVAEVEQLIVTAAHPAAGMTAVPAFCLITVAEADIRTQLHIY